ncbi:hypothetical protein B0H14DRAFT_3496847 [Mycena olivaceomarginata]|nr:hypothetical protein B0H14DRAFT_3496847 [Mycena olivaceomarginata]
MDPLQSTSSYSSSYSSRNRSSLGFSFSLGPQQLADLCLHEANSFPASNPNSRSLDPNSSFLDIFDGSDNEQRGMVDRMRLWRHDAVMQHLYATAAFWGDRLGKAPDRLDTPDAPHPTTARLPMGPGGIIEVPEDMQNGVSRLVNMSVACRYLAAQCHMRQGNWTDAIEMLGEANPFRNSRQSGPAIPNLNGGIKIEASMCNLRGIVMLKLNRVSKAKQCFMEALALDVKCVDAFERLVSGEMMTPDEGSVQGPIGAVSVMCNDEVLSARIGSGDTVAEHVAESPATPQSPDHNSLWQKVMAAGFWSLLDN